MINVPLDKPIVFFDLETTGLFTDTDRIVQIALVKIFPNGDVIKKCRLLNPEREISKGATGVHGITQKTIENEPTFNNVSKSLFSIFDGCDTGGFNSRIFDLPILRNEFKRAGIEYNYLDYKDVDVFILEKYIRKIENNKIKNNSKLTELYNHYTGKYLDGAHDALIDVIGTIDVFNGQISRISNYTIQKICDFIPNKGSYVVKKSKILLIDDIYYWNFGKYKGDSVIIDYNYAKWFVGKNDFPLDERKIVSDKLKIYE